MFDGGRAQPGDSIRSAPPDLSAGAALAGRLGQPQLRCRGDGPGARGAAGRMSSAPVGTLVDQMLQDSDNVIADVLARQVALAQHATASFLGGAAAIRSVLARLGVQVGGGMRDGSGLAAGDRVSPDALTGVLRLIAGAAGGAAAAGARGAFDALPVAGWSARTRGFLAGYPMVDFRVTVYDGSYHDVDSNELSFKLAGSLAFKDAMTPRPTDDSRAGDGRRGLRTVGLRRRPDGRPERPPRPHRRHGHARRHDDHQGAGADVRDADLRTAPDLGDRRPRLVSHGVLALRRGAVAPANQDHRRRQRPSAPAWKSKRSDRGLGARGRGLGGPRAGRSILFSNHPQPAPPAPAMPETPILRFYGSGGTDHAGRTLEEILAWDDRHLEEVHDYIQWLFPLEEPSRANPCTPRSSLPKTSPRSDEAHRVARSAASILHPDSGILRTRGRRVGRRHGDPPVA